MSIGKKQEQFSNMLPMLINRMIADGLGVRIGDVWAHDVNPIISFLESARQYMPDHLIDKFNKSLSSLKEMRHSEHSCHYIKCAADINLIDNNSLITDSKEHEPYGIYWESLGGAWGGRFKDKSGRPRPDGNHYSIEHNGYK